jgi:hypothetical protein
MGVRDVDAIFGGGQPLGTCVLLEEDRWTLDFGWSLVRYWCAEVSQIKVFSVCYRFLVADFSLCPLGDFAKTIPLDPYFTSCYGW